MVVPRGHGEPVRGGQFGSHNYQQNYFAPVTQDLFVGGLERLADVCFNPAPLARDLDLARFTGRERLITRIDSFIGDKPRGYVLIQSEAGAGKSALAAHLVVTRSWLHHFTGLLPGGRSPETARKSLAAQLIARWGLRDWAPGGILPPSSARPDWFARLLEAAAHERDSTDDDGTPIVLVVDGLDEADPEGPGDRGLPLGLPESLPDGVYVVATSRFGTDRSLHAIRNPAEWLQIEVEGADNLDDMRRFLEDVTSPGRGDLVLLKALSGVADFDIARFCAKVAELCAGVWIYLRYVLDEIRDGTRHPDSVGQLPGDLAGYYAEQIQRWRGSPNDEASQRRWRATRLPLLGALGAARAPLTASELGSYAGVRSPEAVHTFLEETARAFLSRRDDVDGPPQYALRHQSLRDLLNGAVPAGRHDLPSLARMLSGQVSEAHKQITSALIPPGAVAGRDWGSVGPYARQHLALHAAECGALDALASDPGFLLTADARTILGQRDRLVTRDGAAAIAAFELTLDGWESVTGAARIAQLAANAARVRAGALLAACSERSPDEWQIRWVAWVGHRHRKLGRHGGPVNAVAVATGGVKDAIISGAHDQKIRVWDALTGQPATPSLVGHTGPVDAVAIGTIAGRDVIVTGSADGTVRMWELATGRFLPPPLTGHRVGVRAVAVGHADGRDVILAGANDRYPRALRVWDAVTGECSQGLLGGGRDDWVDVLAIGRVGGRDVVLTCSTSEHRQLVRVWDAATGSHIAVLAGHDAPVRVAAIGRAGDRDAIVTGSDDGTVRVWDAVTGQPIAILAGRDHAVRSLAVGDVEGRGVIVTGSRDWSARIWDALTGQQLLSSIGGHSSAVHEGPVNGVAIGRVEGRDVIVTGSGDRTVRVWDVGSGHKADPSLAGHSDWVSAVAIGRAGDRVVIVTGSYDRTVRIWDPLAGVPVSTSFTAHDDSVRALAIGRVGGRDIVVTGSDDATARVWDAATGRPRLAPLIGHGGPVHAVATRRGIIVTGSADGTARVWDANDGHAISAGLIAHDDWVRAVAIGRVGGRDVVVTGSDDGTARVWDAATGEPVAVLITSEAAPVAAVAIGRVGGRDVIVTGSDDGTAQIWDPIAGLPLAGPFIGHNGGVTAVAMGQAGESSIIATGSADRTVRIWDAVTCQPLAAPLIGHDDWVLAVSIGRIEGRDIIATGAADHALMVYEYKPGNRQKYAG